jgi:hypothetical protein
MTFPDSYWVYISWAVQDIAVCSLHKLRFPSLGLCVRVTLHATPIKVSVRLGSLELCRVYWCQQAWVHPAAICRRLLAVSVISPFVCPIFIFTLQRIEVYTLCANGDVVLMHFFRSALSWPQILLVSVPERSVFVSQTFCFYSVMDTNSDISEITAASLSYTLKPLLLVFPSYVPYCFLP